MSRAAIYCRVSSPHQAAEGKFSLPQQEADCREWLTRIGGYEVVLVEYEEGVTGTKKDRAAMNRILDAAEEGKIDAVCLAFVDRMARGR